MSIVFQVIDLNCQAADRSFFVPAVTLTTKSTTRFATVFGFSEFVNPSSPPKKYRRVAISGFSRRVGFTVEQTPRQCAGAKYVWSGTGVVDLKGNVVQKYSKLFLAQCPKQFWPSEPLQTLPGAVPTGDLLPGFVAFCWPDWASSCGICDPNEPNWPSLGDQALSTPHGLETIDLKGFLHNASDVTTTQTTFAVNGTFFGITEIAIDTPYSAQVSGTTVNNYPVAVGANTYTGRGTVTNPSPLEFPIIGLKDGGFDPNANFFQTGAFINFTDTANYSATLSDEYTDAMAAANADVVIGTGSVAQNLPRTTGFTTITTNVVFTLQCTNLIPGTDYTVTVDLWDQPANTHTPKTYNFNADSATHTIIDSVPTPAAGHTIAVSKPVIAFA